MRSALETHKCDGIDTIYRVDQIYMPHNMLSYPTIDSAAIHIRVIQVV